MTSYLVTIIIKTFEKSPTHPQKLQLFFSICLKCCINKNRYKVTIFDLKHFYPL